MGWVGVSERASKRGREGGREVHSEGLREGGVLMYGCQK